MQSMKYNVYEEAENRQICQDTFVTVNGSGQPSDKTERRFGQNCVKRIAVILLLAVAIAALATIFTLHLQLKDTWHREHQNIAETLDQIKEMNSNDSAKVDIAVRKLNDTILQLEDAGAENSAKVDIAVRKLNDTILQLEDASAENGKIRGEPTKWAYAYLVSSSNVKRKAGVFNGPRIFKYELNILIKRAQYLDFHQVKGIGKNLLDDNKEPDYTNSWSENWCLHMETLKET